MAQFAIALVKSNSVSAYTSVYSPYGGNLTTLKRNILGDLCLTSERKATTWKTRAGAERKLAELQADVGRAYGYGEYTVVEIGLTDAEIRDNLSANWRDVVSALEDAGKLHLTRIQREGR